MAKFVVLNPPVWVGPNNELRLTEPEYETDDPGEIELLRAAGFPEIEEKPKRRTKKEETEAK